MYQGIELSKDRNTMAKRQREFEKREKAAKKREKREKRQTLPDQPADDAGGEAAVDGD